MQKLEGKVRTDTPVEQSKQKKASQVCRKNVHIWLAFILPDQNVIGRALTEASRLSASHSSGDIYRSSSERYRPAESSRCPG